MLVGLFAWLGGCSSSADTPSNDAGSNDASSITESCYDAAHEGKGTFSFQIDGRAVQLTATSSWVNAYLVVSTPQGDDGGARESWGMEWFGPEVGSRARDPAGGMIYVPPGSASQFVTWRSFGGACTLDAVNNFPRFQAHFDATVVSPDTDAAPTTLHLENGEIDVELPGWCP